MINYNNVIEDIEIYILIEVFEIFIDWKISKFILLK